jgi:hypothetical protein
MNDEKYTHFESRIQNMLVKPEILTVMASASKNPEQFKKDEEERTRQKQAKTDREKAYDKQKQHEQRKKERMLKLKNNTEINDDIKGAIDPAYKQAVNIIETN